MAFQRMATALVRRCCDKKLLDEEFADWYVYTVEKNIVRTIGVLLLVTIGLVCGKLWTTLFLLVGVFPLRRSAGGYHAKTAFRCFSLSALIVLANIFYAIPAILKLGSFAIIGLALLSAVSILLLGPVEHPDAPLPEGSIVPIKKRLAIKASLMLAAAVIMSLFHRTMEPAACIACGMGVAAISVIIGRRLYKKSKKEVHEC